MRSPDAFVSKFPPIGRKRETKGNETGNEEETKRGFLCKTGNGQKMNNGNEEGIFRGSSFPLFPPHTRLQKRGRPGGKHPSVTSEIAGTGRHSAVADNTYQPRHLPGCLPAGRGDNMSAPSPSLCARFLLGAFGRPARVFLDLHGCESRP
jgi:hypothetical protein